MSLGDEGTRICHEHVGSFVRLTIRVQNRVFRIAAHSGRSDFVDYLTWFSNTVVILF